MYRTLCYIRVNNQQANITIINAYVTTENGSRLCNVAATFDLYIATTKFNHKTYDKISCMIPGKREGI